MRKLTKEWLLEQNPCSDGLAFADSCGFDFAKIWQTCDREDWLIWLLRKAGLLDKPTSVRLAIECAEHVLEHFEKKYPNDKRPRKAIEAARKWLEDPTASASASAAYAASAASASASAAYAAASAAASAAYAAASAAASASASAASASASAASAASSASAAWASSGCAAYAADASGCAAYAADAYAASASAAYAAASAAWASSAYASRTSERKWQADKIRESIPNPFTKADVQTRKGRAYAIN